MIADANNRPRYRRRDRRALLLASLLPLACCAFVVGAAAQRQPAAKPAQQQQPAQPAQSRPSPQSQTPQRPQPSAAARSAAGEKYFTDVELIDQDGRKLRLYSDLLKDKVVVINAFFATCRGSCLPMNRNLERVQETFRDRMGKDLYIISISVDPLVDTPSALSAYAKQLNAVPGRLFVTGEKRNVDFALAKLGQYVEQREQHTNIFIVGNERTGLWKKVFGLAKAEEIIQSVESVINDKGAPGAGGAK